MHTVVPQLLMRAYEINPDLYTDGQLNIPESGNDIPDLLDEALWGVAAWEALQDDDGGVRMGVESYRHPLYSHANYDEDPYWTYTKDANTSARAAGIFAQAARLVEEYDQTASDRLKKEAIDAYNYAVANDASDYFMFYASGELYRLTKRAVYKNYFEAAWERGASLPWDFPNLAEFQLQMSDYIGGDPQGAMPD